MKRAHEVVSDQIKEWWMEVTVRNPHQYLMWVEGGDVKDESFVDEQTRTGQIPKTNEGPDDKSCAQPCVRGDAMPRDAALLRDVYHYLVIGRCGVPLVQGIGNSDGASPCEGTFVFS
jgi:hypothetical protein